MCELQDPFQDNRLRCHQASLGPAPRSYHGFVRSDTRLGYNTIESIANALPTHFSMPAHRETLAVADAQNL